MNESPVESAVITESGTPRKCLACGYDLTGLGEEPRCPECGLLNIPDGYRKQVWELVDSGKWFFSPMFGPFQKRLPGWWWALDRPGDVKRSVKAAVRNVVIAVLIAGAGVAASSSVVSEYTYTIVVYNQADPTRTPVDRADSMFQARGPTGARGFETSETKPYTSEHATYGASSHSVAIRRPSVNPRAALTWIACLVLTWAVPAYIGMCSQIRKSLPPFARARRTILAAGNYESHRLIYGASIAALVLIGDALLRWSQLLQGWAANFSKTAEYTEVGVVAAYCALAWVGPVRSDYTKQLVRSRIHAVRIVFMYGLAIPWFLLWFPVVAWKFTF